MAEKPVRRFPKLSANFFRGTFVGQVASVVKTLETNPEKAAQFLQAIKEGAIKVPLFETLPVRTIKGLKRLGVEVSTETAATVEEIVPSS
jgi:hypothetical protein